MEDLTNTRSTRNKLAQRRFREKQKLLEENQKEELNELIIQAQRLLSI